MVNPFVTAVLVGGVLGILSGLGTGGGSLLILWLTLVQQIPDFQARAMNLLFFLPSALIACLFRWKQGHLDIKKVLPAILAGSITAAIFAWFGRQWNTEILKKIFGFLLVITGVRELLYRPKAQ